MESHVSNPGSASGWRLNGVILVLGLLLLALVLALTAACASDVGDSLTRNTVRLSLAWYTAALCLMMRLDRADWSASTVPGRVTRWLWSWALVCFLVHLAMAFHYYHNWSHEHAFARTRSVSGVGEGIYVSYLFTWLWGADVAAWWLWPQRYARRSVWIDRALHAFMLFMVFNGMIVFETGPIRWAGVALFVFLPAMWLTRQQGRQLQAA